METGERKGFYCDLPVDLYEWLRQYAFDRRETKIDVVRRALARERDDPSPVPEVPERAQPAKKKPGRPRKVRGQ